MKKPMLFFLIFLWVFACAPEDKTLFYMVPSDHSGIGFVNEVLENDSLNILLEQYMYNGGGVGVGDFNNDGLQDLYFTGNLKANAMYLNRGALRFDDITELSGTACTDIWSSGVSVVDINGDGWDDIYISATFHKDAAQRRNKLLVNQGLKDGVPYFIDMAEDYGIADDSYSTHSAFFDYDRDGDLDLYVLVDQLFIKRSASLEPTVRDGSSSNSDKLYRNNGDGTFTNVSHEAGILTEGFGLGVAIDDINRDGWPDIYVSNDFVTNDILYINQGDGTFRDEIASYINHQSFSSMGVDIGDLDNDGLMEIMTLDMLPEEDARMKTMFGANQYQYFDIMERSGYTLQMYRNVVQWNRGNGRFSEVAQLLGTQATDWSWSVLMADYDNDGDNDITVSNGFPRDITDLDFINYRSGANRMLAINQAMLDQIPQVKINNYYFENHGGMKFSNASEEAGFRLPTFSNGAVYADLDNDGDLDYVVNNINDISQLYENKQQNSNSYIRIHAGDDTNRYRYIGASVTVYANGKEQRKSFNPYKGYISTVEPYLHFGLGLASAIDSVLIRWPDGNYECYTDLQINQLHHLLPGHGRVTNGPSLPDDEKYFTIYHSVLDSFRHKDILFFDFNVQKLMPHSISMEGPGSAVADFNGDGLDDIMIGTGRGAPLTYFLANQEKGFTRYEIELEGLPEVTSISLLDIDNDNDQDLYLCVGSSEYPANSADLHDRLLINNGSGQFEEAESWIPKLSISTSVAIANDYDKDGDLDLFLAARSIPQSYPIPANGYLLVNEGGRLTLDNAQSELFKDLGLVSSALWTDVNNDGWMDLMVGGEWMNIRLFINQEGKLIDQSVSFGLDETSGWWQSITPADVNGDGYMDYIAGNQGLNNSFKVSREEPAEIIAKDFDGNGSLDNFMFIYKDGKQVPHALLKDVKGQLAYLQKRFSTFKEYSIAGLEDIFDKSELQDAYRARIQMFESVVLLNRQDHFEIRQLPVEAQISPLYAMVCQDVDMDGNIDLILAGNKYGTERMSGRHDASIGQLLMNDGEGNFTAVAPAKSGIYFQGDVKSLNTILDAEGRLILIAGTNNGPLQAFQWSTAKRTSLRRMKTACQYCVLEYTNGRKYKVENGSSRSFAQSSFPVIPGNSNVVSSHCFDGNGNKIE